MASSIYAQAKEVWSRFGEDATLDDLSILLGELDEVYFEESLNAGEEEEEDGETN